MDFELCIFFKVDARWGVAEKSQYRAVNQGVYGIQDGITKEHFGKNAGEPK